jgi:P4 family phage/plasmid primase-like protien
MSNATIQNYTAPASPKASQRVTRADRLVSSLEKVPEALRREQRWVAYLGQHDHKPESEMGLAGGASLAVPSTWLDAAGAIELVRSNRAAKGIAFVTGDGWHAYVLRNGMARAETPTGHDLVLPDPSLMDHDWHEPADDGTDDARVLTRMAVDTSEPLNPAYPTEVRWADHGHRLMAFPVPTLMPTPGEPLCMVELLELAEDMDGYADALDQALTDPKPFARLLFTAALQHGVPSQAHATDVVSEVMGNLNLPLSKRELDTLYTAVKSTATGGGKQRKARAKSDDERAFIDDIDQARELNQMLAEAGHRYCWEERRWLLRDPKTGRMCRATSEEHHGVQSQALAFTQSKAALLDLGKRSAAGHGRSLAFTATHDPVCHVSAADLDGDPYLVGVPSGVYDLRTGETRPARVGEYVTRSIAVDPDPNYADGLWCSDFLPNRVPDPDHLRVLHAYAGYTLSGRKDHKAFVVLHGSPDTGKSTVLQVMTHLMADYAKPIGNGIYLSRHGDEGNDKRAYGDIVGSRMVYVDELGSDKTLNETYIKSLTSGGESRVFAERKYEHGFSAPVQCCLWIGTNVLPRIRLGGTALVERCRIIPFDMWIERKNTAYTQRLMSPVEMAKIAGWAVAGYAMLLRDGAAALAPTAAMREAATDWLQDGAYNPMQRFVADVYEQTEDEGAFEHSSDVPHRYEAWRVQQRPAVDAAFSHQVFADALRNAGMCAVTGLRSAVAKSTKRMADGLQVRGWKHLRAKPDVGLTPRPIDIPY